MVSGLTDACGIDETEGDTLQVDGVFDGVTGGAMYVGDDGAFLMKQPVEQSGFSYVGLADNGNGNALLDGLSYLK